MYSICSVEMCRTYGARAFTRNPPFRAGLKFGARPSGLDADTDLHVRSTLTCRRQVSARDDNC